ncbi:hypothetical protein E3N88_22652 [Mikania micrantha]|uniref:Uncharacterized protein n=1 Tax=Mikania micrantha TaxID=192012 RepID=A0A5N6NB20_9ASTR|nr:hypothetical protein E3N88_22652 [Mikania micrantha]
MFQGLGCSPIKAVLELGSECRETVRSISSVGVGALRGPFPSTRGPGRTHLWCTSYRAHGKRWVAKCEADAVTRFSHLCTNKHLELKCHDTTHLKVA